MTDIELRNENGKIVGYDSDGNKVPVSFEDAEADSFSTDGASIGETDPYEYVSESHTLVSVPDDYNTIQAAIDDCPKNLRHRYVIEIANGTYDEDLVIRGVGHQGTTNDSATLGGGVGGPGELGLLQIVGDRSNPSNVTVNSIAALGCTGVGSPIIWGVGFSGDESPEVDESACVVFSGCQQGAMGDCLVQDGAATQGILSYGGQLHVRDTEVHTQTGIAGKRGARIHARGITGSTTSRFYLSEASICHMGDHAAVDAGDLAFSDSAEGSVYYRDDNGPVYPGGWLHMDNGTAALNENLGGAEFRFRDAVNGVIRFRSSGKGFGTTHIENLSGQTGDFDGQERLDDGTNTPHRATKCVWDDVNSVWVDQTDGSTFS